MTVTSKDGSGRTPARGWFLALVSVTLAAALIGCGDDGHRDAASGLPAGESGLDLPAITAGPDGAVWFIQTTTDPKLPSEAIGRLALGGHCARIPLRHMHVGATDLTAGPNGAMWVTQQSRYSIARVTEHGSIREFPLRPGTVPGSIIKGRDGALWFTTRTGVGRITTDGRIRIWPIRRAKQLGSITQGRDGSFWIIDGPADVVHHFVPPNP